MASLPQRNERPAHSPPPEADDRPGILPLPTAALAPAAEASFLASIPQPSSALYIVKNGLSAFLMSLLARRRAHDKQIVVSSGSVAQLPREEILRTIDAAHYTRVHASTTLRAMMERVGFWIDHLRGRMVHVYHTYSFEDQVRRLAGPLFPPHRRVIVEHGTVELFRYIGECRAGVVDERRVFLLSFFDETMRYLRKQGVEPTLSAYPFPYPDDFLHVPGPEDRECALFAVQPLVDDGVLSADDCHRALKQFLARRPRKFYKVKPHPRDCRLTTAVILGALNEGGYRFELLTDQADPIEKAFPALGCSEVCSFYSTASMLTSRLYRIPFDTAIPEILKYTTVRKSHQLDLIRTVAALFEIDR